MNFEPTEAQALIQKTARDYAERAIRPVAAELDRHERFGSEILAGLADLGLCGVNVETRYGGAEAGVVAYALAMIEISRACASCAVAMAVTNMVAEVIQAFGTEAQRERHLPRITSGEHVTGAFALSEPGAGSDPGGMTTVARRDGDGWVIDGQKQWITNGAHAGVMVVWARTAGPGTRGISCFLVEKGTPGLSIGRPEDKMGLRSSNTVPLTFDGCRVPADALLGEPEQGFRIAMMALDGGRIGISAQAIGIATAALEAARDYARQRRAFGKAISEFQAIQWMLADSRVELDAARLACLRASWLKEQGRPFSREASMAKLFASEAAVRICNRAMQIHGGYGYVREFAVERHLRDVRVTCIYEGTSEIQRTVIARELLARLSELVSVDLDSVRRALEREIARSQPQDPSATDGMRHAAVAAVLRERGDDTDVLLIRRATLQGDPWSGHMAFPGGRQHASDHDLLATAIRETREEVGLTLGPGDLVGRLAPIPAFARGRATGMFVAPFVFVAPREPVLALDPREVEEALWAPLRPMLKGEIDTVIEWDRDDERVKLPAWDVDGRVVWGLTYRMLSELFEALRR